MKKSILIAIISAAAAALIAVVLFLIVPIATSKTAEQKFSEAISETGIPDDMWSAGKVVYVPVFDHIVIDDLEFGDKWSIGYLKAKKAILKINTSKENIVSGSIDLQDASLSADGGGIIVKNFAVNNFSVDKSMFEYSPIEAIKKLDSISISGGEYRQGGIQYFLVKKFNANLNYTEGKISNSSSISIKDFISDLRKFIPYENLRKEYRLSNIEIKFNRSGLVNLTIDGTNLFSIKSDIDIFLPQEITSSASLSIFDEIDFNDVKLRSISLTFTDRSLLDHIFTLSGMTDNRAAAAQELKEAFLMYAESLGMEEERFANEAVKFITKPGRFEIKSNPVSPMSLEEITENPLAANLSLSINGGKPFTARGY